MFEFFPILVENKLSKSELEDFKEYLIECLSCEFDEMTEDELRTAFDSYCRSHPREDYLE